MVIAMDFYPTRYSNLSNNEVNELYRSEVWTELSLNERTDALQELANRSAEALGNEPCEVKLESMSGATYGMYRNGEIYINESLVEKGVLSVQVDNEITEYPPGDVNAQLMDTVHHENYHAYQVDVMVGAVEHDNAGEVELWQANDLDANYIDEGSLYPIQSLEKSAFEYGERQTKTSFEEIEATHGEDTGYQNYLEYITNHSYENALANAQEMYDNENIEATLNEQMMSNYQDSLVNENTNESEISTEESNDMSISETLSDSDDYSL